MEAVAIMSCSSFQEGANTCSLLSLLQICAHYLSMTQVVPCPVKWNIHNVKPIAHLRLHLFNLLKGLWIFFHTFFMLRLIWQTEDNAVCYPEMWNIHVKCITPLRPYVRNPLKDLEIIGVQFLCSDPHHSVCVELITTSVPRSDPSGLHMNVFSIFRTENIWTTSN